MIDMQTVKNGDTLTLYCGAAVVVRDIQKFYDDFCVHVLDDTVECIVHYNRDGIHKNSVLLNVVEIIPKVQNRWDAFTSFERDIICCALKEYRAFSDRVNAARQLLANEAGKCSG